VGARTRVRIYAINTRTAILAKISSAVIDVMFTIPSRESNGALAGVGQSLIMGHTFPPVLTLVMLTRDVSLVTRLSCESSITITFKTAHKIETNAVSITNGIIFETFVDILGASFAFEALKTLAFKRVAD
jgi:hypothetical protein